MEKMSSTTQATESDSQRLGDLSATNYHTVNFKNQLHRIVEPYFHHFETTCKKRWFGQTLEQMYVKEFLTEEFTAEFYREAIESGFIRVNNEISLPTRVLQHGDIISHLSHRHEPPVVYIPHEKVICYDDGDLIVVNKPGSMPIHPSGSYRFNSLIYILAKENPFSKSQV